MFGVKTENKHTIVFSNGALTNNHVTGFFKFHKCGGKSNAEGRVPPFFPIFTLQYDYKASL